MKKMVNLGFKADDTVRKTTFKKKKKGVSKKLDELVKLSDVKASGIVSSTSESIPEAQPSKEGVEEVATMLKDLSMSSETKKMVDGENDTQDLVMLKEIGESSSLPLPVVVADADADADADTVAADALIRFYDHMNEKRKEPVQQNYQALYDFYDQLPEKLHAFNVKYNLVPNKIMNLDLEGKLDWDSVQMNCQNMNQKRKVPVQINYQPLYDFYDQIPQKLHAFNLKYNVIPNQNMNLDSGENLDLDSDPNKKKPIMDMLKGHPQQMSPSVDDSHQPLTTGHISSASASTTAAAVDVCAPDITYNNP